MKTALIMNPASGKGNVQSKVLEKSISVFSPVEVMVTKRKGDAVQFAARTNAERIVVAGGDGTLNEVLNGVMKRRSKKKVILGIIPVGTSNMVARAFGIPSDVDHAIALIKKGKKQLVDVGKANKRYFLIGAGVGVDATMYKNVQPFVKKIFGEIAYHVALVKTIMTHQPQELMIQCNQKKIRAYYALVCNIGKFSRLFEIIPNSRPNDGMLDVIIFQNKDIMNQFKYCLGIATKKHTSFPDVKTFRVKKLEIKAKNAMVHCDAELIGKTPVWISCKPRAVKIFIP